MRTNFENKLHQVLFALSVLVLVLNIYELTFAIWFVTALVTTKRAYSIRIIGLLLIPTLILAVAFLSAFSNDYKSYNYFRDIAYLVKPILGLLIGYNICKSLGNRILLTIVYVGVALSVIHILTLGVCYSIFQIRDVHQLRHYGGYFNDFEIYVIVMLLFRDRIGIELSTNKARLFILIIAFSSFLYFARTNIIQFFILFFAMKGYLRITKRSLTMLACVTIGVLGSYAAIYYSNPKRLGHGIEAFLYKIKIAPIEAFKTKINKDDWKDFNDNYRSFENIITVRQVVASGTQNVFFGKGLGSTIDLGREVYSNDGEFIRYIPTLHNAYMTVFLKSGLTGVFMLCYFIYLLFYHKRTNEEKIRQINYLLVGSAFFLILSNWVFMGLYLKLDNKSIIFGALFCYREFLQKQHNKVIQQ